jgi:diguanylate cyclase (GGDEF)-like protein/PAS domain S-box-containing protein
MIMHRLNGRSALIWVRILAVGLASALLVFIPVCSAETVKIGVLATASKAKTVARWQPLAVLLKNAAPNRNFMIKAMTAPEMEMAVASRDLDFVLTDPGHYVLLAKRNGLSVPLATLAVDQNGQRTSVFGGVIFSRADQASINTLSDVKGKTIAFVDTGSFDGYQIQALELARVGVRLPQDATLTTTGMPHDSIVESVLAGRADVGFLRSGVLENLARKGLLDVKQIKVLNRQLVPGFPLETSTPLYAEWPFGALPHVDEKLSRHVAATLFQLQENTAATRSMGIRGFSVPADYTTVADLLRELRLPPFDEAPQASMQNDWMRNGLQIIGGFLAIGLILALGAGLLITKRKLETAKRTVLRQEHPLVESDTKLLERLDAIPDLLFELGPDGRFHAFYSPYADPLFFHSGDLIGQRVADLMSPDAAAAVMAALRDANERGESHGRQLELALPSGDTRFELSVVRKDRPLNEEPRFMILLRDVTERNKTEDKIRLAAVVFGHAREGIMITAADGTIIDVNDTFSLITGYSRNEVLGRNPRLLGSGRHDRLFFSAMWRALLEKGHWYGELWNRHKNGTEYAEKLTISAVIDAQGKTKQYVALFSDITLSTQHERELEHVAHYDALTTLPNRVVLADRLHHGMTEALRRGKGLAVCYLDLDSFKVVNEAYGHDAGDHLLMAVASRMKKELRDGDTLARIGGDEFVAVLLDRADFGSCSPMLTTLLSVTAQPVRVKNCVFQVSASLGVTFFPQAEEVDAEQLLRQAHQAMYQAKLAGKNRYSVFDAEHDRSVRGNFANLERVRQALFGHEFVLYFQPRVNLRTGLVVGAEALIRWLHPQQGLLAPSDFLPLIEDHALVIELGEWVISSALKQLEIWQGAGLNVTVSVNIGARQLIQPDFIERLQAILAEFPRVTPGKLMMEVLETSVLEDLAHVSRIIDVCRGIGVNFALDDFGTGYSSLTYLKRLPVTELKIDQSFVRGMLDDPDDLSILEGIIGLARAFHREVIAEGVESTEHGELLLQLGCDLAQGNGIARPMPAADFPAWAATWRADSAWSNRKPVSRDDLPLLFASTEHRAWMVALDRYLKGESNAPPTLDCHQCRLGQWLYAEGATRHGTRAVFQSIERLHRQLHVSATELCALHSKGIHLKLAETDERHHLLDALINEIKAMLG